jgi:hypothetical protein
VRSNNRKSTREDMHDGSRRYQESAGQDLSRFPREAQAQVEEAPRRDEEESGCRFVNRSRVDERASSAFTVLTARLCGLR